MYPSNIYWCPICEFDGDIRWNFFLVVTTSMYTNIPHSKPHQHWHAHSHTTSKILLQVRVFSPRIWSNLDQFTRITPQHLPSLFYHPLSLVISYLASFLNVILTETLTLTLSLTLSDRENRKHDKHNLVIFSLSAIFSKSERLANYESSQ